MKKRNYLELSDRICNVAGCNKRIKRRLVEMREPHNAQRCYKHYHMTKIRLAGAAGAKNRVAITAPITKRKEG